MGGTGWGGGMQLLHRAVPVRLIQACQWGAGTTEQGAGRAGGRHRLGWWHAASGRGSATARTSLTRSRQWDSRRQEGAAVVDCHARLPPLFMRGRGTGQAQHTCTPSPLPQTLPAPPSLHRPFPIVFPRSLPPPCAAYLSPLPWQAAAPHMRDAGKREMEGPEGRPRQRCILNVSSVSGTGERGGRVALGGAGGAAGGRLGGCLRAGPGSLRAMLCMPGAQWPDCLAAWLPN